MRRELPEELDLSIQPEGAEYLGCFPSLAANESDYIVKAQMFSLVTDKEIVSLAEIEEAL